MPPGAGRTPAGAPPSVRRTPGLCVVARVRDLAIALWCAGTIASCAGPYAETPPESPRPAHTADVRIVSLASYSLGDAHDAVHSRALAESAVREATGALERRGYVVVGDVGGAGFADPDLRYDMVLEPVPGEYASRVIRVRSAYVSGDAELTREERRVALGDWVRHLRTPRGVGLMREDSLRLAFRAGPAGGAGRILVVQTHAHAVRTSRRVAEGIVTGVLTLGMAPWWEPSTTSVAVYLVDTETAEVIGYDEWSDRVEGTPDRVGKLVADMVGRLP